MGTWGRCAGPAATAAAALDSGVATGGDVGVGGAGGTTGPDFGELPAAAGGGAGKKGRVCAVPSSPSEEKE